MRTEKRNARMREIEAVAYDLLKRDGYDGTSMLAVARAAKASNETMYRWYGDKNGLFESMVQANAAEVQNTLATLTQGTTPPLEVLGRIAPVLLTMLLGDRAIALNRAAASDPTGALGKAIAQGGRETVLPLLKKVMTDAINAGELSPPAEGEIAALFMHLLVGDQRVRRIIGILAAPSPCAVEAQVKTAMAQFRALCRPRA
ncbi:MAG: TetR/AcrR family transcriptional regulator [Sulfitobacter sp.]